MDYLLNHFICRIVMRFRNRKLLYSLSDRYKISSQRMQKEEEVKKEQVQQVVKKEKKEYVHLKKSVKNGKEFDLHFDKIKNSMVTGGLSAAFTFLSYKIFNNSKKVREPYTKQELQKLEQELPILKPIFEHKLQTQIRYTWIGHSTALIQVGQDNLLIDPVFSQRCSFTQWVGPKRYRKPACEIKDFGKIDIVLVSHDHYDHLDQSSLEELHKLYQPKFVAGLGSKSVFPKKCELREMDWMDQITIPINKNEYKITFVPVCHWSRRGAFDFNERLWGGFVIQTPYNSKIFYSGDTAYTDVFKEIGDAYGPFDLSILPIGAYEPRQLLSPQHVNPQESVQIHLDLKSKKSVGVHWGTFPLGFEAFYQPKYDLQDARKKLQVEEDRFVIVRHGESIEIK